MVQCSARQHNQDHGHLLPHPVVKALGVFPALALSFEELIKNILRNFFREEVTGLGLIRLATYSIQPSEFPTYLRRYLSVPQVYGIGVICKETANVNESLINIFKSFQVVKLAHPFPGLLDHM